MERKRYIVILLVAALIGSAAGGTALAVHALTNSGSQKTTVQSPTVTQTTTTGPGQSGMFPGNGSSETGTVTAINDSTITITKTDNTTANITIGTNTSIQKINTATLADLIAGAYVSVTGETAEDGSVQATEITLTTQTGGSFPQGTMTVPSVSFTGTQTFTGTPPSQGTALSSFTASSLPGNPSTGRGTMGTIESVNGNTISLKTMNGSTTSVIVSDTTAITKESQGSSADITVGSSITVMYTTQSDGTLTAMSITINAG